MIPATRKDVPELMSLMIGRGLGLVPASMALLGSFGSDASRLESRALNSIGSWEALLAVVETYFAF